MDIGYCSVEQSDNTFLITIIIIITLNIIMPINIIIVHELQPDYFILYHQYTRYIILYHSSRANAIVTFDAPQ